MKIITFKDNSWHHKIVKFGYDSFNIGEYNYNGDEICKYVRSFILTVLATLLIITVTSMLIGLMINAIVFTIRNGFIVNTPTYVLFGYMICGTLVIIGLLALIEHIMSLGWYEKIRQLFQNKRQKCNDVYKSSFLKEAYRSLNDKVCFKIKFEE